MPVSTRILVLIAIVSSACGQSSPPESQPVANPSATAAGGEQTSPTPAPIPAFRQVGSGRFSFVVPATWEQIAPPLPQIAMHYRDTVDRHGVRWNVNIWVEPFNGTLQEYASAAEQELRDAGATIHSFELRAEESREVMVTEISLAITTPTTRAVQIGTLSGGEVFVLTCTGPEAGFDEGRAMCAEVLGSMDVVEN